MEFLNALMTNIVDNGVKTPKVQVEREISPILEMFLVEILNSISKENGDYELISSEFPIRKGRIDNTKSNQSTNIDYLLVNNDPKNKKFTFVELKTDSKSFKKKQLNIYHKLQDICDEYKIADNTFGQLLFEDLESIFNATRAKKKYKYMKDKWKDDFNNINEMEIIYIVPTNIKIEPRKNVFNFKDLPSSLEGHKYNTEWKVIRSYLVKLDEN